MKTKSVLFYFLIILLSKQVFAGGVIVLNGLYYGANIYIQNPYASTGIGFCVDSVVVNGIHYDTALHQSSAFEIKLDSMGFKGGELIDIKIYHKDGCRPKNLLPMHCGTPFPSVYIHAMVFDSTGVLHWEAIASDTLMYIIEIFRWDKWINQGAVPAKGVDTAFSYNFPLKLHSGENMVRIKYLDHAGVPRLSKNTSITSTIKPIIITLNTESKTLNMSDSTSYELYNDYGHLLNRGITNQIDFSNFKQRERYYLNYDNNSVTLKLKKERLTLKRSR
jgi:hypothetical protein